MHLAGKQKCSGKPIRLGREGFNSNSPKMEERERTVKRRRKRSRETDNQGRIVEVKMEDRGGGNGEKWKQTKMGTLFNTL